MVAPAEANSEKTEEVAEEINPWEAYAAAERIAAGYDPDDSACIVSCDLESDCSAPEASDPAKAAPGEVEVDLLHPITIATGEDEDVALAADGFAGAVSERARTVRDVPHSGNDLPRLDDDEHGTLLSQHTTRSDEHGSPAFDADVVAAERASAVAPRSGDEAEGPRPRLNDDGLHDGDGDGEPKQRQGQAFKSSGPVRAHPPPPRRLGS